MEEKRKRVEMLAVIKVLEGGRGDGITG